MFQTLSEVSCHAAIDVPFLSVQTSGYFFTVPPSASEIVTTLESHLRSDPKNLTAAIASEPPFHLSKTNHSPG
jgi:hypothetical protein